MFQSSLLLVHSRSEISQIFNRQQTTFVSITGSANYHGNSYCVEADGNGETEMGKNNMGVGMVGQNTSSLSTQF